MPSSADEMLHTFAASLLRNFQSGIQAQPEDQLKAPIDRLLSQSADLLGLDVVARTETSPYEIDGRPDFGVAVGGLLSGHIELKAPGTGARADRFRGRNKLQWEKFSSLPNLLYTDGNDWVLFRTGEMIRRVRLRGDVTQDGPDAIGSNDPAELLELLQVFLAWQPIVPATSHQLADVLAPLCRLLRSDVLAALHDPSSNLSQLQNDWQVYLFPESDDSQFADAYAQTLTYALLLARIDGAVEGGTDSAVAALRPAHALLAQVLRVLTDAGARVEIEIPVNLLERAIAAVDVERLRRRSHDPWIYFYEHFLAAYDPKLRKDRGVYYTPVPVVLCQVRLVGQLLSEWFGKELSYADEDVTTLDPALGTGTYLLAAADYALAEVESRMGEGARAGYASELARNLHGFEILVGPYAVAHLRITERVRSSGGVLPDDGAHVYLTDTLDSPHASPPDQLPLPYRQLTEEHRRAQKVKEETKVLVCIGNPPYNRQVIDPSNADVEHRKGGWVRFGEHGQLNPPILQDFIEPAREAGAGVHLKNLYNDYVYFWRWALWKVFESVDGPGITSFITASSYIRGPGFVGMRQLMRQTFDELWIVDLEGDSIGARKTENVFAIRTPVAIALGVRYGDHSDPETPADVHYARVTGTSNEKLDFLEGMRNFSDFTWSSCMEGWQDPFLPQGEGNFYSWPLLTNLFPWTVGGAQMKRTWVFASDEEVLQRRWDEFLRSRDRALAFRQTRDRKINRNYPHLFGRPDDPALNTLHSDAPLPSVRRYGYRSLDRQYVLADNRFGDFMRPSIWRAHSPQQIYITSLLTKVLGSGPAVMASAEVPDLDFFAARGAKDVVPLWKDAAASEPNVTKGVLELLTAHFGGQVQPEGLLCYVYGLLVSDQYVERFSEELTVPGPRLPITRDFQLFTEVARAGRRAIWLHTYADRFAGHDSLAEEIPPGRARCTSPVSEAEERFPQEFSFDEDNHSLRVEDGVFAPVSPEVWEFSLSGFRVVRSWLSARISTGSRRPGSPLDHVGPRNWTNDYTAELLRLLWVIERTLELQPELAELLDRVLQSPLFDANDFPQPSEEERRPTEVISVSRSESQRSLDL